MGGQIVSKVLDFLGKRYHRPQILQMISEGELYLRSHILQLLGLEFCKENRSRILEMATGEGLYSGSHILQRTKRDLWGSFLKGTKGVFEMVSYRRK